jgi:hypothetical protein
MHCGGVPLGAANQDSLVFSICAEQDDTYYLKTELKLNFIGVLSFLAFSHPHLLNNHFPDAGFFEHMEGRGIINFPLYSKKLPDLLLRYKQDHYESFRKVTANRSPFFNLKSMNQEYILLILLANAASTPSFPKVSD